MKLDELYSFNEAIEYLNVPEGTWRNHIHVQELVTPIRLGERWGDQAYALLFTRRMLDHYLKHKEAEPTQHEMSQIYDSAAAAEYLGLTRSALKYHIYVSKRIPCKTVGSVNVFLKRDLDNFQATKRPVGRPVGRTDAKPRKKRGEG